MQKPSTHSLSGVLSRLCKDQSGNVMAIAAAATLPLIAMVGGAVDMSRVYAVRIGLQAACDAGALAGRKRMSNGVFDTNTQNFANSVFTANFKNNAFGASNLTRSFSGSDGMVTGTATASVPMTLMSIFGASSKSVSVTCTSNMRIPHTDVMFVLDTTGSMNCAPGDTIATCTNNGGVEKSDSRMKGLRTAVNCFVETMAKADTGEVCATTGADPTPTGLSSSVQLRVGFVPYSSNVNVGKLLPNDYFANNRTFQSREPVTQTVQTWTHDGASLPSTPSAWVPATRPAAQGSAYVNSTDHFSTTWTDLGGTSTTITINRIGTTSITRPSRITGTAGSTSANCIANNDYSTAPTAAKRIETVGDVALTSSTSYGTYTTPTYPAANRTRTNTETQPVQLRAYQYRWVSTATSGTRCRLHWAVGSVPAASWSQARNINESQPISWTAIQELIGWTLKPTTFDVSAFKAGGSNWNNSASVPNAGSATLSVQKSGSASATNIAIPGPATINWTGCIEERQTYMNTDGDPSDDWKPTIPAAAKDMDIDSAPDPSDPTTLWGFALPDLIHRRYDAYGNRTTANNTISGSGWGGTLNQLACPAQAQLMKKATDAGSTTLATNVRTYTNSLIATGGTYHDIGLLWGARLMSPSGIFAATNALDSLGQPITRQRHMVFMTDGGTGTCSWSYTPYGMSWWDRRQTNKADPSDDTGTTSCTNSHTNAITDARTAALCTEIKNKNITIWVVSFGLGVDTTTETRLKNCASSANHFYDANSTAQLKTAFEEIALQISRLRLQN